MPSSKFYFETSLAFEGEPLDLAVRVAETFANDDYVLYEHDGEWSLGMGAHARVTLFANSVVVEAKDGSERVFEDKDPSLAIQAALDSLDVAHWRVYGTADFELSRHNFGLPLDDPGKSLARMFVPEMEVRVREGEVDLRALDVDDFSALAKGVAALVDSPPYPAAPRTLDVPAVDTHMAAEYEASVATAVAEIQRHDYRKVILSRQVPVPERLNMSASYVEGRRGNTPARSYLLRLDGLQVAGFSPETVVEVSEEREVRTTPLAGTRALGADLQEEMELREELVSDSKEIAEHAMSVYAAFDEMTMICDPETVMVKQFMIVSRRGSVQHLASRLIGNLLGRSNPWHAFTALFPAVTASGLPKGGSIDAIGRLEAAPRGLYSGCVMICDASGMLDGALVLRSIYQKGDDTWLRAGAGIVDRSRPERELEETREKMRSCSAFLVPEGG